MKHFHSSVTKGLKWDVKNTVRNYFDLSSFWDIYKVKMTPFSESFIFLCSESVWYLALLWSPFQAKPQSRGMNKRIDVVFLMLFTPPVHISSEYFGYHDIFPQLNLYLIFKVNTAYGNGRHWHSSGSHYNVLSGTFLTIHTDVFNRVNMRYNSVRFIFKSWNKQQSITWAWNPVKTTDHICWTNLV